MFGTIVDFRTSNPNDRALLQGTLSVKLTVISKEGDLLLPEEKFSVSFPDEKSKRHVFFPTIRLDEDLLNGRKATQDITEEHIKTDHVGD